MRVYQVYDEDNPAGTDSFHRTRKEATAHKRFLMNPSPVFMHEILTSKAGIIEALMELPQRGAERVHLAQPKEDVWTGGDTEPELEFDAPEPSAELGDEEPELEI